MVISFTIFLGMFFNLIQLWSSLLVIWFLVIITGFPLKLFWDAISSLI